MRQRVQRCLDRYPEAATLMKTSLGKCFNKRLVAWFFFILRCLQSKGESSYVPATCHQNGCLESPWIKILGMPISFYPPFA